MKKSLALLSSTFAACAVAALIVSSCHAETDKTEKVNAGKPAPELSVTQWIQGPEMQVTTGQVTVVEFWATWCPPCLESIPHLNEIYKTHKENGLAVVGLSDEKPNVVKAFVEKQGDKMTYPVAIGSKADYANYMGAWGVNGIPHAFVVGREGDVVWQGHPMEPAFENAIKKALDKDSADALK